MAVAWGGTFPKDWRRVRLKNLIASMTSGVWGDEPLDDDGVLCVRAADFDREHLRVSLAKTPLRSIPPQQLQSCALAPGDLILEKSGGGDQQPVGAVVMFDHPVVAVPTNFAARIRPAPDVDARFLCYVFAAAYGLRLNVRSIKQTTGLQNLDVSSFLAEEWAVPIYGSQSLIADYLDRETTRIDGLVNRLQALLACIESRRESEVFHAVTHGVDHHARLTESGLEWAGKMPNHWGTPTVSANFEVQLGKMLNPERAAGPNPAPYVRNVNVQWDRIDLDDLDFMDFDAEDRIRYSLREGDLLVCEGGEVGRAAIWQGGLDECYYQKAIHRVRPRTDCSARFLMYGLWAAASMNVFSVEGNQATIVHLTAEQLREHRFPLPPKREQEAIVDYLDKRNHQTKLLVDKVGLQLEKLDERRKAIITAATTGLLDVSVDDPAA